MQPTNPNDQQDKKPVEPTTNTAKSKDENVAAAHDQAEADIEQDADLSSAPDPGDDLDEGELAQLDNENDDNPLI